MMNSIHGFSNKACGMETCIPALGVAVGSVRSEEDRFGENEARKNERENKGMMKLSLLFRIRILASLVCLLGFGELFAQHNFELYNNGGVIYVSPGDFISVHGDVHMEGGSLENQGLIEVQGNMYSNTGFQQRGTGTVRLENNDVNTTDQQFISGSFAVRGGQSQIGNNDGSFYNLELANTQGIVYLVGAGNVADVRNQVDFNPAMASGTPPVNRIITHDLSLGVPANGSNYAAVFGVLNPAPGFSGMLNNTVAINGTSSALDDGYVQGRLRRAIAGTGGQYPFVLGLEPAGALAQRGLQYARLDFVSNTYDVIEGYFETGSSNIITGAPAECGYTVNYFGGADHGEWVFEDIGVGNGTYEIWIWPQDDNFPIQSTWFITKDDQVLGNLGQCGPSPVGLSRSAFTGFSEFGVAAGTIVLPVTLSDVAAIPVENEFIQVKWSTVREENLDHFEIERSIDHVLFSHIGSADAVGNSANSLKYELNDLDVLPGIDYYYRLKMVDIDGAGQYSETVSARLLPGGAIADVQLYPNPLTDGALQVDIHLQKAGNASLMVVDGWGKVVRSIVLDLNGGSNNYQMATRELPAGPYMVRVQGADFSVVKKFVKAN